MGTITVAIPTLNGAAVLEDTLSAVRAQRLEPRLDVELVVCDSGSRDGSVTIARRYGAQVIQIRPEEFSHGATRNLLMERSGGDHVVFLTQDSVPAGERWLAELLGGFDLADDVALTFGPYRPRPEASVMVARELTQWFQSFSSDGAPRLDRLAPSERDIAPIELLGPRLLHRCQRMRGQSRVAVHPLPACSLCRGPRPGARHDARRLCEGLPAPRGRHPLPRLLGVGLAAAIVRRVSGAQRDLRLRAAARPALARPASVGTGWGRLALGPRWSTGRIPANGCQWDRRPVAAAPLSPHRRRASLGQGPTATARTRTATFAGRHRSRSSRGNRIRLRSAVADQIAMILARRHLGSSSQTYTRPGEEGVCHRKPHSES